MGKDGFTWFVGVVEDRADPKKVGRVKVRCLGYHTKDKVKLPTTDLPWAHVMNPITSATVSGVGQTPLGVVEGTWVVGFFTDGDEAQMILLSSRFTHARYLGRNLSLGEYNKTELDNIISSA